MLEKKEFIQVIKNAPLVSIDLVICSQDYKLLMGLRVNEPAAGSWFVPGGCIRKNETLEQAFNRITDDELGKPYAIDNARLLGAFTHHYSTNFALEPGISTHYVVLAYQLQIDTDQIMFPKVQHSDYRWFGKNDNLEGVHAYSEAYFEFL